MNQGLRRILAGQEVHQGNQYEMGWSHAQAHSICGVGGTDLPLLWPPTVILQGQEARWTGGLRRLDVDEDWVGAAIVLWLSDIKNRTTAMRSFIVNKKDQLHG